MGTRGSKQIGPDAYHSGTAKSKGNKGMFAKSKREFKPAKTPGVGVYFQEGRFRLKDDAHIYTMPRQQRVLMGDITKPDYDMSVFYVQKGPNVKPKIGGYTISNTGGTDAVSDPSKLAQPGVGHYAVSHAFSKTTFEKHGPSYSVPQAGRISIQASLLKE